MQVALSSAHKHILCTLLACLIAMTWLAKPAAAASSTATFNVTANVATACSFTAADLAYGTYDPTSGVDKTGTSTLSVTCTLGTPYTLSLDNGSNASAGVRRMKLGSTYLSYHLYRDLAHLLVFGLVSGGLGVSGVGTGVAIPTTVYGTVTNSQTVGPGTYTDTVTATMDY